MPVPALITDLNTVAASNSPAGSETVFPSLDDYLRAGFSFTAQLNANKAPLASPAFTGTPSFAGSNVTWASITTHSGDHVITGSVTVNNTLTVNGNTVLGDAVGDTLTVRPNAVTWASTTQHSGTHRYTGSVAVGQAAAPTQLLDVAGFKVSGATSIAGNITVATTIPINAANQLGGGLVLVRGADVSGVAFTRLYIVAMRVNGGAAPDLASTQIGTAGSTTPTFTFSNVSGFLNITSASNNQAYASVIGC